MRKLGTVRPYLKMIQKTSKNQVTQSIFSPEISSFCYIKKHRYRLHFNKQFLILLTFFESLKVVLINMVANLMMLAKLATLGLPKAKVFRNKS